MQILILSMTLTMCFVVSSHENSWINWRKFEATQTYTSSRTLDVLCLFQYAIVDLGRETLANRKSFYCEFSFQLPVNVGVLEFLIRMNQIFVPVLVYDSIGWPLCLFCIKLSALDHF